MKSAEARKAHLKPGHRRKRSATGAERRVHAELDPFGKARSVHRRRRSRSTPPPSTGSSSPWAYRGEDPDPGGRIAPGDLDGGGGPARLGGGKASIETRPATRRWPSGGPGRTSRSRPLAGLPRSGRYITDQIKAAPGGVAPSSTPVVRGLHTMAVDERAGRTTLATFAKTLSDTGRQIIICIQPSRIRRRRSAVACSRRATPCSPGLRHPQRRGPGPMSDTAGGRLDHKVLSSRQGEGQGIGRGIALALAKKGATSPSWSGTPRRRVHADELTALGARSWPWWLDVVGRRRAASPSSRRSTPRQLDPRQQRRGRQRGKPFEVHLDDDFELDAVDGGWGLAARFMRAAFAPPPRAWQKIVNIGSVGGTTGTSGMAASMPRPRRIRGLSKVATSGASTASTSTWCPHRRPRRSRRSTTSRRGPRSTRCASSSGRPARRAIPRATSAEPSSTSPGGQRLRDPRA